MSVAAPSGGQSPNTGVPPEPINSVPPASNTSVPPDGGAAAAPRGLGRVRRVSGISVKTSTVTSADLASLKPHAEHLPPLTLEELKPLWQEMLDRMKEEHPKLVGILKERELPYDTDGHNWLTFSEGKRVLIDVGDLDLNKGDKILSWSERPTAKIRFRLAGDRNGMMISKSDGLFYEPQSCVIFIK